MNDQKNPEDDPAEEEPLSEERRRMLLEGFTVDGYYYTTNGREDDSPVYKYHPNTLKGVDVVERGDDGSIEATAVANHEEAEAGPLEEGEIEGKLDKMSDGLGVWGTAVIERRQQTVDLGEDLEDRIRGNYREHGFTVEDEDGEERVVSLITEEPRTLRYITGSHLGSTEPPIDTVEQYREAVASALADIININPDGVVIAPGDLVQTFHEAGDGGGE